MSVHQVGVEAPKVKLFKGEYLSPEQHRNLFGNIYRVYFNGELPDFLTSGDNVSNLMDFCLNVTNMGSRFCARGLSSDGAGLANIVLQNISGKSNLQIITTDEFADNLNNGWVDYTR